MTESNEEIPWEGRCAFAASEFALRCREPRDSNPYSESELGDPVLVYLINFLMTDLWDQTFSQTEITTAFKSAIERLPNYAAGEERRGGRQSKR
jgi:hypothetical protein